MISKIKIINYFSALFFLIAVSNDALALSVTKKTDKVSATIITDKDEIKRGENISVLVRLEMLDNWHTYWKNAGQAGEGTKIEWNSDGVYSATRINQSSPIVFTTDEIVQYGYDRTVYFLYKLTPNEKSLNIYDKYVFEVTISYLACREECVPEKIRLEFSIPITEKDMLPTKKWNLELAKAKASFPIKNNWESTYKKTDKDSILIELMVNPLNFAKLHNVRYIPHEEGIIDDALPQIIELTEDSIILEVPLEYTNIKHLELEGVLLIDNKVYEIAPKFIDEVVHLEDGFHESVEKTGANTFFWILSAAFLGGLILNLMPCIFPILSLKAISLVQSANNPKESRIEALMYFMGVVISFMIIATILALLRIKGERVGWGFQLQSPIFVMSMIVIFFIIFLMLLDLITIKVPFAHVGRISFHRKRINSFFTGLFSVLIASPCTAPFMGIAIGYTLSRPLYIFYPIFLSLSIGYALPFTLVGFFPNTLHKILPKPGKWMIVLKKIFSIPILLTCIWLTWVLYNQVNKTEGTEQVNNVVWKTYDKEKVTQAVESGKPVFIDFTAKWCITCLMNKKIALNTEEFAKIVKEKGIQTFRADWTNYDEEIELALERYGRNSIPLYIYYPKGSQQYKILPQIITIDILRNNLNQSLKN